MTCVLLASSRSAGNTRALVDLAFPGEDFVLENLAQLDIAFYSYEDAHDADDFLPLVQRMLKHETWVIATPLYWYSMSGQAKTFLDRLSGLLSTHRAIGHRLRGRKLAVLCSGTDPAPPASFDEPFRLTCRYLGMEFLGSHYERFDGQRPAEQSARQRAADFGRTVIES